MLPTDSLSAFALAALIALLITYLLMRRRPAKARARSTRNDALDTVADWPPEAARVLTTPERKAYEIAASRAAGYTGAGAGAAVALLARADAPFVQPVDARVSAASVPTCWCATAARACWP